jgi:hypothetical protein
MTHFSVGQKEKQSSPLSLAVTSTFEMLQGHMCSQLKSPKLGDRDTLSQLVPSRGRISVGSFMLAFVVARLMFGLVDAANEVDSLDIKGKPGSTKGKQLALNFDSSRAKRVLGLEFTQLQTTIKDSLAYFKDASKTA